MPPVLSIIHQNVFCKDCDTRYLENRSGWDMENNVCQACSARRQVRLKQRVVLRLPTGKSCMLCKHFLSEDSFCDREGNTYERCKGCRKSELCSACRIIKKRKYFLKSAEEQGTSRYWKTCKVCRLQVQLRTFQKREAARARGTSFCIGTIKN